MNDNYTRGEGDAPRDIFETKVHAGRRTYFFDVKATRNGDRFINITESRKTDEADGSVRFDKVKIRLYGEDLDKFMNGLHAAMEHIK